MCKFSSKNVIQNTNKSHSKVKTRVKTSILLRFYVSDSNLECKNVSFFESFKNPVLLVQNNTHCKLFNEIH